MSTSQWKSLYKLCEPIKHTVGITQTALTKYTEKSTKSSNKSSSPGVWLCQLWMLMTGRAMLSYPWIFLYFFFFCTTEWLSLIKFSDTDYTLLPFSFDAPKIITEKSHFKLEQQFTQPFSCSKETLLFVCLCVWSVLLLNLFPHLVRNMTRLYVELMCTI